MFQKLRTIVYSAQDLARAKDWYSQLLGMQPYFDEVFYVGFDVNSFELGLDPNTPASGQAGYITYWKVDSAKDAYERMRAMGATMHQAPHSVGGDITIASVVDPFGNVVGVIEEK